jgi:hypothetical protein
MLLSINYYTAKELKIQYILPISRRQKYTKFQNSFVAILTKDFNLSPAAVHQGRRMGKNAAFRLNRALFRRDSSGFSDQLLRFFRAR